MADLQFEALGPTFYRCTIEIADSTYSSGVIFDCPLDDEKTKRALQAVGAAFAFVQQKEPSLLHAEVAAELPCEADRNMFARCELSSLSAVWDSEANAPSVSLAYGFDDGVYAVATMNDSTIASVLLNG